MHAPSMDGTEQSEVRSRPLSNVGEPWWTAVGRTQAEERTRIFERFVSKPMPIPPDAAPYRTATWNVGERGVLIASKIRFLIVGERSGDPCPGGWMEKVKYLHDGSEHEIPNADLLQHARKPTEEEDQAWPR